MTVLDQVHTECAALGIRLFTVTTHDHAAGLARRSYTSHPAEYPVQGTKPLTRDAWYDQCIVRLEPFVANTPEGFRAQFFDHALIESLGLGSAVNLPVIGREGRVVATVNLLAEAGHFSAERLAAYVGILNRHHAELVAACG
ncbi:MAG: GAF domain-containing protein [Rhodobacteraceae bacterium]|jgi:hypothetical protein|nr:GAF domain-containing protein [Paracoccaceae bacterium]